MSRRVSALVQPHRLVGLLELVVFKPAVEIVSMSDEGHLAVRFHCWPEGRDLDVLLGGLQDPGLIDVWCWRLVEAFVKASRLAAGTAPCPVCGTWVEVSPLTFDENDGI